MSPGFAVDSLAVFEMASVHWAALADSLKVTVPELFPFGASVATPVVTALPTLETAAGAVQVDGRVVSKQIWEGSPL